MTEPSPRTPITVPWFVGRGNEIGAGEYVARLTALFGITQCSACAARAMALNLILRLRDPRSTPEN